MQYGIHVNLDEDSQEDVPYVLDIQSNLLNNLPTTVVIPLQRSTNFVTHKISGLHPCFEINEQMYYLMTPNISFIPKELLGKLVLDARLSSHDIVAAIDYLLSGV